MFIMWMVLCIYMLFYMWHTSYVFIPLHVCVLSVCLSVLLCDIPAMSQLYMALYISVAGPCVWGPCVYMYAHASVCALYIGICALVYV